MNVTFNDRGPRIMPQQCLGARCGRARFCRVDQFEDAVFVDRPIKANPEFGRTSRTECDTWTSKPVQRHSEKRNRWALIRNEYRGLPDRNENRPTASISHAGWAIGTKVLRT